MRRTRAGASSGQTSAARVFVIPSVERLYVHLVHRSIHWFIHIGTLVHSFVQILKQTTRLKASAALYFGVRVDDLHCVYRVLYAQTVTDGVSGRPPLYVPGTL